MAPAAIVLAPDVALRGVVPPVADVTLILEVVFLVELVRPRTAVADPFEPAIILLGVTLSCEAVDIKSVVGVVLLFQVTLLVGVVMPFPATEIAPLIGVGTPFKVDDLTTLVGVVVVFAADELTPPVCFTIFKVGEIMPPIGTVSPFKAGTLKLLVEPVTFKEAMLLVEVAPFKVDEMTSPITLLESGDIIPPLGVMLPLVADGIAKPTGISTPFEADSFMALFCVLLAFKGATPSVDEVEPFDAEEKSFEVDEIETRVGVATPLEAAEVPFPTAEIMTLVEIAAPVMS